MRAIARLLAATDLSAPARHAVLRGFRIAAATGAHYTVIHALELDAIDALREWFGDDVARIKRNLESRAQEALSGLLSDPTRTCGVAADAEILHGAPLAEIPALADRLDADLLVLGARGSEFMRHMLLGSTASRLLRKVTGRAVLVVKQPPHEDYRRVLVPVDFSRDSASALRTARLLAPEADIFLLHAYEAPFESKLAYAGVDEEIIQQYRASARTEALRRMHEAALAANLSPTDYVPLAIHGDPSQQVVAQEQELGCDLIAMGKHGRNVTEELLLGSVTKNVLARSQCDVLVIAGVDVDGSGRREGR